MLYNNVIKLHLKMELCLTSNFHWVDEFEVKGVVLGWYLFAWTVEGKMKCSMYQIKLSNLMKLNLIFSHLHCPNFLVSGMKVYNLRAFDVCDSIEEGISGKYDQCMYIWGISDYQLSRICRQDASLPKYAKKSDH